MRPTAHIPAVLVTLLALIAIPNPVSADFTWQDQVIASNAIDRIRGAVADSSGNLHFIAEKNPDLLIYGEWSGGSAVLETLYTTNGLSYSMDIQIAPDGRVGVVFGDGEADVLRLAERVAGNWTFAVVDSSDIYTAALGYDSGNRAHVTYDRNFDAYYCNNVTGTWSCSQFHVDSLQIWAADALTITSGDTVHAAVNLSGPSDFYDENSATMDYNLSLPPIADTIKALQSGFPQPVDTRVAADGTLHVLSSNYLIEGIDCVGNGARVYSRSSGSWTESLIHVPESYPTDPVPHAFDFSSVGDIHAIYSSRFFPSDVFCDPCAMECELGIPSGIPECAQACSTDGLIRYTRPVDSVLVQELIPGTADDEAVLLHLDESDTPQVLAGRGTDVVIYTRNVSTGVAGGTGDASTPDALPASGLRVTVSPNPSTRAFSFALAPGGGLARVDVFDIRGRRVRSIAARAGSGSAVTRESRLLTWDGTDASGRRVAKGVYFARFDFGNRTETHKLTIVR